MAKRFMVLAVAALLLSVRSAWAEPAGGFGAMRMMGPRGDAVDYSFQLAPGGGASSGPEPAPQILENSLRLSKLVHEDDHDSYSVNTRLGSFHLNEPVVIPATGVRVPPDLWDVEAGAAYTHKIEERREYGGSFSVGSASDSPFTNWNTTVFQLNARYQMPDGEENTWIFFVNWSNNRYFLNYIPLPGAAYVIHSKAHGIDAVVGFPFASILYRPAPRWSLSAAAFGPSFFSAEAGYAVAPPARVYLGFNKYPELWLRADRTDNSNRLFFDQMRACLGVQSPLSKEFSGDLSAGYAFARRFFEATSTFAHGIQYGDLEPSWFLSLKIGWHPATH